MRMARLIPGSELRYIYANRWPIGIDLKYTWFELNFFVQSSKDIT